MYLIECPVKDNDKVSLELFIHNSLASLKDLLLAVCRQSLLTLKEKTLIFTLFSLTLYDFPSDGGTH